MLRVRRYRIFLVAAIFSVVVLYQFTPIRSWRLESPSVNFRHGSGPGAEKTQKPIHGDNGKKLAEFAPQPERIAPTVPAAKPLDSETPKAYRTSDSVNSAAPTSADRVPVTPPQRTDAPTLKSFKGVHRPEEESPQRWEDPQDLYPELSTTPDHWTKVPERYPIPSESIIQLPTGKPKKLPKIQYEGGLETKQQKIVREVRLAAVREALNHTWTGYKQNAWLQDELRPVTGGSRNPFGAWGATLVDTLDTLWIMGFKDEFDEAAKAVNQIDFTTSFRDDIPLFETTIRYLGGLISAYDVSDGKYRNLLDKAVELAEILMSAFDTPNHMPVTYYRWRPVYASMPLRASSKVVMSEMGSLSVEFTRLAQITKEPRYYDAVARITNEFEAWQNNTRLPGMWPLAVDASGCRETYHPSLYEYDEEQTGRPVQQPSDDPTPADELRKPTVDKDEVYESEKGTPGHNLGWGPDDSLHKREEIHYSSSRTNLGFHTGLEEESQCEHQGLASTPNTMHEEFSLGGQSDSTYEYLPKEYILLGGVNEQYKTMYEQAMEAVKKHLLYRPMTIDNRDILISGAISVSTTYRDKTHFLAEATHLTCFAGGMLAIGSKIFDRPDELDLAAKLADGCVWAYNSTATGIMPEDFIAVRCEEASNCAWNESKWWDALDPFYKSREERRLKEKEEMRLLSEDSPKTEEEEEEKLPSGEASTTEGLDSQWKGKSKRRRQLDPDPDATTQPSHGEENDEDPISPNQARTTSNQPSDPDEYEAPLPSRTDALARIAPPSLSSSEDEGYTYTPPPPPSHEEYVKARIANERLPPGFAGIRSREYILRPEAIESVFIMYRVTGDKAWQEKGWAMFESIVRATRTTYGHTAIRDVTSSVPVPSNQMESFWSAETLKYFYLLFEEPSVVSLDEWVLMGWDESCRLAANRAKNKRAKDGQTASQQSRQKKEGLIITSLSMHSLLILLLTSTPFTLCLSPSDIPHDTPISSLISSANAHLSQGDYHSALTYFDVAISHDPQNYLPIFKRGITYLSLGKTAQASQDFDVVLRIRPDFEAALLQRAKLRSKHADWVGARADYEAAGKQDEAAEVEEAQAAADLAAEAEAKGDWEGCVANSGRAIVTASTALGLRQLRARCRLERGEVHEAVSDLAHVLQMAPGATEPHLQMSAMLFYSLADTERGLGQVRRCLHSDPDSKLCSRLFRREKKVEKVLKWVRELMEKRRYDGAVKLLVKTGGKREEEQPGLIQLVKDEIRELRDAGTIHQKAPDDLLALLTEMACEAYTEMNNPKRAHPHCTETLTHNPHSLPALLSQAQHLLSKSDPEGAMTTLQKAREQHPEAAQRIQALLQQAQAALRKSKQKDYYGTLGLSSDADERAIKRAYRQLTKQHHPDKAIKTGIGKEAAEKKMASINEAYEVLSNPELKARFDAGDDPNAPPGAGGHGGQPFYGSPFFGADGFGGGAGHHHQHQHQHQQQFVFQSGPAGAAGAAGGFKFPGGFPFAGGAGGAGHGGGQGQGGGFRFQFP
ncbi:MAG: hypothetical protein M1816_007047 [Peltula sp. TS41687]|nr:MAG: hypothetical protein M1816_007047 [Peltula sp. TS41687]